MKNVIGDIGKGELENVVIDGRREEFCAMREWKEGFSRLKDTIVLDPVQVGFGSREEAVARASCAVEILDKRDKNVD